MPHGGISSRIHASGEMNQHQQPEDSLLKVCSLLNKHGASYLIVGGHACILHGLVRTTEDVDVLIEESVDNYKKVIAALSELEDHAASELQVDDFDENIVIKVADEVEVDISRRAWTVDFHSAARNSRKVTIEGVVVPYLGLSDLIESKATYREKDKWDIQMLKKLSDPEHNSRAETPTTSRLRHFLKRLFRVSGDNP
jgi:uncharacterized protein (DUF1330 family)